MPPTMYGLKTRLLDDRQRETLKKAIGLYLTDLYKKNNAGIIDDELLAVELSVIDEIGDELHLKHL